MTKTKPYSKESIGRALVHHETSGVIYTWSPPGPGQSKWRVALYDQEPLQLTNREAYIVCVALASAETKAANDAG